MHFKVYNLMIMVLYFFLDFTSHNNFALNDIDDYETGSSSSSSISTYKSINKNEIKDDKNELIEGIICIYNYITIIVIFIYVYFFRRSCEKGKTLFIRISN